MAATTEQIKTGLDVTWPMTFAQDRFRRVYGVNGIDRPIHWDTFGSTADNMGITVPVDAPAVAAAGSGSLTGTYNCYFRYVDDRDGHKRYSSLSPVNSPVASSDAHFDWLGISPTTAVESRINKVQLWRTIDRDVSSNDIYLIAERGYVGNITSSADSGGNVIYTVPDGHGLQVDDRIEVFNHSVGGYDGYQLVTAVTDTTVKTDKTYSSDGTGGTWTYEGLDTDNSTDATLMALKGTASHQLITKEDGDPNANRFTIPPTNMGVIVRYGDRALMAVPRNYSTGTVSTTANSDDITGSGTAFTSDMVGRTIEIDGEPQAYVIESQSSATAIVIEEAATNTLSGKSFIVRPTAAELLQIRYSEVDEFESMPATYTITVQENVSDLDKLTGLIPLGSFCIVAMERHLHRLQFFAQPRIDANVSYWKNRGMISQRCWALHESLTLYVMDENGPYMLNSDGMIVPIGDAIQNQWRDDTIDWANKRWFYVHLDPLEELVYFFVGFTADSSTRPQRAFVWSIRRQQWMPGADKYVWELGGIARVDVSGQQKSVMGAENDKFYFLNDGTQDGTAGANTVRGTATAATSTTLTDTAATFPTDVVESTVAIVRGTGKGQLRRVSTRNSASQITVASAWATTPDTTSVYVIGAVEYNGKLGKFELLPLSEDNKQSFRMAFTPTTNDAEFYLRRFMDHDAAATAPDERNDDMFDKGIEWAQDDVDIILDMKLARSTLADQNGDHRWEWGGHVGGPDHTAYESKWRWVQPEIAGFQGADAHEFHELTIEGVPQR